MKAAFFVLFLCSITVLGAETPQEVAKRIIASESPPPYNVRNATDEELNVAAAVNSQLQLRSIMLSDSVSEELRTCYALRVIQEHLGISRVPGTGAPPTTTEQRLLRDRSVLASYLRQLSEIKK